MDADFPFDDTDSSILSSEPSSILTPTVQSTPDEIDMTCTSTAIAGNNFVHPTLLDIPDVFKPRRRAAQVTVG
jgi:hypothetical protein